MARLREHNPDEILIVRAAWLHSVAVPPIADGALAFRDGKILAVGPAAEIGRDYPQAMRFEYPEGTLIPGLVNAHAHLELTYMKDLVPPRENFTDWILDLVRYKRSWTEDEYEKSARAGRRELIRGGCTAAGDILSAEGEQGVLAAHLEDGPPLRLRAYQEYLGVFGEGRRPYEADPERLFFPGLSPHAPYSSDRDLYRRCIALARERGLPLSTHGAEIRWEAEYMLKGGGPLFEFLRRLGFADDAPRAWDITRSLRLADWLAAEKPRGPLQFVHGTWLAEEEFASLREIGATVVYCPASVAYFHDGRDPHPVEKLLAAGIPVALGTDSLASGHTLNMPETCSLAKRAHPSLAMDAILEMATRSGARSLGFENCGVLAAGMAADFLVFDSPGARPSAAGEALEMALFSGFRVPELHAVAGEIHTFADIPPLKA